IEDYEITPNGEIITFRRYNMEEVGREDCCYALWQDNQTNHLVFGLLNSARTYGIGISVNDHLDLVRGHIEKIVRTKSVSVTYRYIPAPAEPLGSGMVCEIIPTEIRTEREVPENVISQLKQILVILEKYE
ncbi:MAG: hypothetical protein ACFFDF_18360, partial [Candidatus Odinarchaeota archaeon]